MAKKPDGSKNDDGPENERGCINISKALVNKLIAEWKISFPTEEKPNTSLMARTLLNEALEARAQKRSVASTRQTG